MENNEHSEQFAHHTDEALAALCQKGIEAAERELLGRYMQAIYWLPHRIFGADEEDLSGFLIYAIEKIRERDTLSKYDKTKGARFSTWIGTVIRNLYLDYIRSLPSEPFNIEFEENSFPSQDNRRQGGRKSLLDLMQIKCRVMFKLLLCDTFFLESEEISWIAQESGQSLIQTSENIAKLEENLRFGEEKLKARYEKLSRAYYWKSTYEKKLHSMEKTRDTATAEEIRELRELERKLVKRRREYENILEDLSGMGGIVTAPYRELAKLLNISEGTLASSISRCRSGAADLLRRLRNNP